MNADPREWRKLPKFILGDTCRGNEGIFEDNAATYVIHCHEPRFMMAFAFGTENDLYLIDTAEDETLLPLMRKAREFFFEMNPSLRA